MPDFYHQQYDVWRRTMETIPTSMLLLATRLVWTMLHLPTYASVRLPASDAAYY